MSTISLYAFRLSNHRNTPLSIGRSRFIAKLRNFCECFSLVQEYLSETETAMTKAETGEFLFDDLRELAANHAQQKIEFEKLIPENISLGLFVVSFVFRLNTIRSRTHAETPLRMRLW